MKAAHEQLREAIAAERRRAAEGAASRPRRERAAARRAFPGAARDAEPRSCSRSRTASRSTRSSRSSSSGGSRRSAPRVGSTGRRPRRSRSASLLVEGTPVRLTGQDTERGTFAHRHLVLHDVETGEHVRADPAPPGREAPIEVYNSPLSEAGCLGFEYGYAVATPEGARHLGGPVRRLRERRADHHRPVHRVQPLEVGADVTAHPAPPARLRGQRARALERAVERFMQMAAQENIRIVNCTTAAQYFHVLRRQALHPKARPLIVLTPKSLLRLKQATSPARRSSPRAASSRSSTTRASTKRRAAETRASSSAPGRSTTTSPATRPAESAERVAVARLEQLYPFPVAPTTSCSRATRTHRGRVGPGGAAEHGRVARDPPPPRGGAPGGGRPALLRPALAREPERGLPDRAPRSSRTGSSPRRSTSNRQ